MLRATTPLSGASNGIALVSRLVLFSHLKSTVNNLLTRRRNIFMPTLRPTEPSISNGFTASMHRPASKPRSKPNLKMLTPHLPPTAPKPDICGFSKLMAPPADMYASTYAFNAPLRYFWLNDMRVVTSVRIPFADSIRYASERNSLTNSAVIGFVSEPMFIFQPFGFEK